jgi:hypothetical protein
MSNGTIIKNHSRLRFAQLAIADGITFWDLLDLPYIPPQTDDIQYTVNMNDRIDSLAYQFYKDPVLWWVIAEANDLEILPTDLQTGMVIRIPSPRYVLQLLFQNIQISTT